MFGKKRPSKECTVTARAASGAVLLDVPVAELDPPEAAMIVLSVEFFNDPQPCEIHRGAVRWRVQQQLLERCPRDEDVPIDALDEVMRRVFPEGTHSIRLTEAAK